MTEGIFTGLKRTSSADSADVVIDMSGVRALESTLGYIRFLENKKKELREQNDFLEDEKRRCYLDMKKDEETIERLKRSNLYLTQIVIDSYSKSKKQSQSRRKLGRKWRAR